MPWMDASLTVGLQESTLFTGQDSAKKIKKTAQLRIAASTKKTSKVRNYIRKWILNLGNGTKIRIIAHCNRVVSMFRAQEKAHKIMTELQKESAIKPFAASAVWFTDFGWRCSYHSIKMSRRLHLPKPHLLSTKNIQTWLSWMRTIPTVNEAPTCAEMCAQPGSTTERSCRRKKSQLKDIALLHLQKHQEPMYHLNLQYLQPHCPTPSSFSP